MQQGKQLNPSEHGSSQCHSVSIVSRVRNSSPTVLVTWVKDGVRDFSISRSAVQWGISIPNDPVQTVYVWFDALIGGCCLASSLLPIYFVGRVQDILVHLAPYLVVMLAWPRIQFYWDDRHLQAVHAALEFPEFVCLQFAVIRDAG
eukprot:1157623-Pelagomonas_calceolata.AAC.3